MPIRVSVLNDASKYVYADARESKEKHFALFFAWIFIFLFV